jgi:predicted amidohydrolase YtcJ
VKATLLLALALVACGSVDSCSPLEADLILVDGRVFTADPELPFAEAIAIRDDRIVAVGASSELRERAVPSARVLALGGRLVVPGVNDAHTHLSPRPAGLELEGLAEDPSWPEVLAGIASATSRASADGWIYGTIGARTLDDPSVDRAAIDALAPRQAVLLTCWSGHGAIANSEAMRRLGIGEHEPDPPGGFYVRRTGDRTLTGVAHEYADFRTPLAARATAEELSARVRAYDENARSLGITTVQMMTVGDWAADPAPVLARSDARVRWRFIDFTSVPPADWTPPAERSERAADALVYRSGTKWILDGTPVERLMWIRTPYTDRPDTRGRMNFPTDTLAPAFARALAAHEPLLLHAVGDATIDAIFDALDATGGPDAWRAERVRIEHGDLLTPDRFARARALGVVVVQNPSHFTIRPIMETRLGAARMAHSQVVQSMLAAGVPLALGSDGPQSPWLNMLFATTHPVNPAEALTREQVLAAYTAGSAFAEFSEASKGMLRAGMLADLAVLSQDVLTVPAADLPATKSVLTLVGGQIVHDDGTLEASR